MPFSPAVENLEAMLEALRSALTPARPVTAALRAAADPAAARAALLERIYREHADRVFGLCLRMSGDRHRATELAQDVFVHAWEKLDLLRPETDAGAWLWRLATRVVLNALRGERRRLARVAPVAELAPLERVALETPLPVRRLSIDAAIARLPQKARAVYLLCDVEGFSSPEAAEALGIAEGTVRAHLHRARSLMREALR